MFFRNFLNFFFSSFLLEKNTLTNVNWENKSILLYLGCFSLLQFIFYAIMAYVLKESGATALQLYLLTADFYTLLFCILLKNTKVSIEHFIRYFYLHFKLIFNPHRQ